MHKNRIFLFLFSNQKAVSTNKHSRGLAHVNLAKATECVDQNRPRINAS